MDYGLILVIAAYLAALQLAMRTNAGALLCSFVAVGVPYIVGIIIRWIIIQAQSAALFADLFPLSGVATFVLQLVVAFIVFKKIRNEDNFVSIVGWSIGGFVIIIMLIPFLVQKII